MNTNKQPNEIRSVEDLVKEARNDFDLAKASAGREVSMSYWLTETITQDRQQVVEAMCGVIDQMVTDEPLFVGKTQYEFYKGDIRWVANQALSDAKTAIKNLLDDNK